MAVAGCLMPPPPITAKAEAISSGLTGEVPSAREGTLCSGLPIPILAAISATLSAPIFIMVFTA
ncbi:hypothetical protein D3C81_1594440 [compost metagenome]